MEWCISEHQGNIYKGLNPFGILKHYSPKNSTNAFGIAHHHHHHLTQICVLYFLLNMLQLRNQSMAPYSLAVAHVHSFLEDPK
ncbi:hypothetical protein XELAEV_18010915mg [Xenopus laevis]|uniref:Uncharacterized protein n=1 Tax=Xenopus laevis TaxID=8355 RepID=A0A974DV42_XENLA|nr:hypothetical protein XELAEV_18010915mg [Xenopus laevis]